MHDCCMISPVGVGSVDVDSGSNMITAQFAGDAVASQSVVLAIVLVVISLFATIRSSIGNSLVQFVQRKRNALERYIQFYCNIILFRKGILHSKVW